MKGISREHSSDALAGRYAAELGMDDTKAVRRRIVALGGAERLRAMLPEARALMLGSAIYRFPKPKKRSVKHITPREKSCQ